MTEGRRRGFEASSPKISLRTDHLASNGLNSSLSTGIDSPASASGRSANNLWGFTSQPAVHDVSDLVEPGSSSRGSLRMMSSGPSGSGLKDHPGSSNTFSEDVEGESDNASKRFSRLVTHRLLHIDQQYLGSTFSSGGSFRALSKFLFVEGKTGQDLLSASRHAGSIGTSSSAVHSRWLRRVLRPLDKLRLRLGLTRVVFWILCCLLVLGLWDVWHSVIHSSAHLSSMDLHHRPSLQNFYLREDDRLPRAIQSVSPDVTAVLLNWKRPDNLAVLVKHICALAFVHHVLIYNNNPSTYLTREHLATAECPASRLQIFNAPTNSLFIARHLACSTMTHTPYCMFVDDEYVFWSAEHAYSIFKSDPQAGLVVAADPPSSVLFQRDWCYTASNNSAVPLDTCFSWLGYGSFVSRASVARFVQALTAERWPQDEVALADNYFATLGESRRSASVVLQAEEATLNVQQGFSDGTSGLERNKDYITRGVQRLVDKLNAQPAGDDPSKLDDRPAFFPFIRAACATQRCYMMSNVQTLPPPPAFELASANQTVPSLQEREQSIGYVGPSQSQRNSLADKKTQSVEKWSVNYPYQDAVDGDYQSAWRSTQSVRPGDWIGLGLFSPWTDWSKLRFSLSMEHEDTILPKTRLEVSRDGHVWEPVHKSQAGTFSCSTTQIPLKLLSEPLPLQSSWGSKGEDAASSRQWLKKHGRLAECFIELGTKMPSDSREGWRFVRLVYVGAEPLNVGWAVYEMSIII